MASERTGLARYFDLYSFRSALSENQKLNYIDAVKCLSKKPAKTPTAIASGAESRFDDFIVTHIQQTMSIHGTVCEEGNITRLRLMHLRETSSAGIATTSGSTSKLFAMSAGITATFRTTTGRNGQRIRFHPLSLTAVTQVSLAMANTLRDEDHGAFLAKHAAWSLSTPQMVEAASSLDRSKSTLIKSEPDRQLVD